MQKILNYCYLIKERLVKFIWNRSIKRSRINGIVLMYHHLSDIHMDNELDCCQHTTEEFLHSLEMVEERGYQFVSLEESLLLMKKKSHQKFVVVTFDDVSSSMYNIAYPLLKKRNIPFTLFITIDYVDKQGFLSREQIMEMSQDLLCTVGAHTKTHPFLRKSKDTDTELVAAKKCLEDLIGKQVKAMAYPYGKYSSVSKNIMKKTKAAGYDCAYGTIDAPITDMTAQEWYFLPRMILK